MKKIGICITARVDSERLPNKILRRIGNKRALQILLEHVIISNKFFPVVLAIPKSQKNDKIVRAVEEDNIPVEIYRGEDESPLHRLVAVGNQKQWDYIIRVTADDLFIDQMLLRRQVNFCINNDYDYVYMGTCPEGFAAEVIRMDALRKIVKKVGDKPIEFISYLLKTDEFKFTEYFPEANYQFPFRFTLDYPEDLLLIRTVLSNLPHDYKILDVIHYIKRNRHLLAINALPKVTVYIANCNQSKYVLEAIASVFAQTFQDWELHIWDDNSTDDSVKQIMKFLTQSSFELRKRCQVFVNEKNLGLPTLCNRALKNARGKYILRLDADDILAPYALQEMLKKIESEPRIKGVFTGYNEFKDDENSGITILPENNRFKKHPACCLLSKACVNEIKYRDGLEYFEGDEFLHRFEKLYSTTVIRSALWHYRRHPGQKTDPENDKKRQIVRERLEREGIEVK